MQKAVYKVMPTGEKLTGEKLNIIEKKNIKGMKLAIGEHASTRLCID